VKLLLNKKANLYALDHRDWSPLHYAAYNGHPKVVKKLLTWGADQDPKLRNIVNSQNKIAFNICKNPETKFGFRIIWPAARDGNLDMVRVLIREGQDPNEQTEHERNTPLHLAAKNGHYLIVKFLMEMNANILLINRAGKTAI
jgi:ankyrin repeat protein